VLILHLINAEGQDAGCALSQVRIEDHRVHLQAPGTGIAFL
jgi:hypothetical protein